MMVSSRMEITESLFFAPCKNVPCWMEMTDSPFLAPCRMVASRVEISDSSFFASFEHGTM